MSHRHQRWWQQHDGVWLPGSRRDATIKKRCVWYMLQNIVLEQPELAHRFHLILLKSWCFSIQRYFIFYQFSSNFVLTVCVNNMQLLSDELKYWLWARAYPITSVAVQGHAKSRIRCVKKHQPLLIFILSFITVVQSCLIVLINQGASWIICHLLNCT